MGRADLADDPGLANILTRWKRRDEISDLIAEWTKTHTVDQMLALAGRRTALQPHCGSDGTTIPSSIMCSSTGISSICPEVTSCGLGHHSRNHGGDSTPLGAITRARIDVTS